MSAGGGRAVAGACIRRDVTLGRSVGGRRTNLRVINLQALVTRMPHQDRRMGPLCFLAADQRTLGFPWAGEQD
jgi:hypothetical protein